LNWFKEFPRDRFLELIASGMVEDEALDAINADRKASLHFTNVTLVQLQVQDASFKSNLEQAKKTRADVWFNGIAKSVTSTIDKEMVAGEKLKFEQRKYLASIDNPEKYSEKVRHEHQHEVNIFAEIKNLDAKKVKAIMNEADPFKLPTNENIPDAEVIPQDEEDILT
jgi:hypothetical protein